MAQARAASNYPFELIQRQQGLAKNPGLKDNELADPNCSGKLLFRRD